MIQQNDPQWRQLVPEKAWRIAERQAKISK
jgi:hypothetical protein